MGNSTIDCIKERVNKKKAIVVYSGTLAIESALISLNIGLNDKVLIASSVCYSIPEAIIKIGAIPVIVVPKNGLIFCEEEVQEVIKKENIRCIILVHQYGIGQSIKSIRNIAPSIPIIEDIAQAWGIKIKGEKIGEYSDVVITSFGKTKPLSLGYGGALFSDNDLSEIFDFYNIDSRENKSKMVPYYFEYATNINFNKLMHKADKIVSKQRAVATILSGLFTIKGIEGYIEDNGDLFTWHRFPINIKNRKMFNTIRELLEKNDVKYQFPHDEELFEIPLLKHSKFKLYNNYKKRNILIIRTRTNKLRNVKKFVNAVKKFYSN